MNRRHLKPLIISGVFFLLIIALLFCEEDAPDLLPPTPSLAPTMECPENTWQAGFECVNQTLLRAPVSYDGALYYHIWHTDTYGGEQDPLCRSYNGALFGEKARKTLFAWGGTPHLVHDGEATARIKMGDPSGASVYEINLAGKRLRKVDAKAEGDELVVKMSVRNPEGKARMIYEIAVE